MQAGLPLQILAWGGTGPPHRGGTQGGGQGSDGGGLARDSRQNQLSTITRVQTFDNKLYLG